MGSLKTKPSTDGVATRSTSPPSAEKGHVLARLLGKAKEYTACLPISSGQLDSILLFCRQETEGQNLLPFDDPRLPEGLCDGFTNSACKHGDGSQIEGAIREARALVAKQVALPSRPDYPD